MKTMRITHWAALIAVIVALPFVTLIATGHLPHKLTLDEIQARANAHPIGRNL